MADSFQFTDSISVTIAGKYYDLHNCFDFKGIDVSGDERLVSVLFKTNPDFIDHTGGNHVIQLIFHDITHIEKSPAVAAGSLNHLEEVGFKNPTDNDLDWLIDVSKSSPGDHLIFRFENDEFLRLQSTKWTAKVGDQ